MRPPPARTKTKMTNAALRYAEAKGLHGGDTRYRNNVARSFGLLLVAALFPCSDTVILGSAWNLAPSPSPCPRAPTRGPNTRYSSMRHINFYEAAMNREEVEEYLEQVERLVVKLDGLT